MTCQLAAVVLKDMKLKSLKLQVRCQVNPWDDSTAKKGYLYIYLCFKDILHQYVNLGFFELNAKYVVKQHLSNERVCFFFFLLLPQ